MDIIKIFTTYIHYLIHPFKTHDYLLQKEEDSDLLHLSVYESLGTSWIFVVINGLIRIVLLNILLVFILDIIEQSSMDLAQVFNIAEVPGYSFFVLSAILDVIFYPLFGFFIIQYWEVIIKLFSRLLETPGDITKKAQDIISVSFASQILKIVPVFGAPIQSLASMILMYAGLRKQLNASPALSFCIILSPVFIILFLFSILMVFSLFLMK